MNQVALVGRLTKEPALKYLNGGSALATFTLAVTRNFKNQQGEFEADFIYCTCWGRTAENLKKYCGKGSLIAVGGRIQSRSFTNMEGKRVSLTEVIADDIRFLALKKQNPTENTLNEFELPI